MWTPPRSGAIVALWFAVAAPPAGAAADYLRDIKPALKARCYSCHGALKQEAGLRLDTAERIHAGGEDGAVLDGELLARITHYDPEQRMPPEGKPLADATIAAIREWVAAGAPAPESEAGDDDPRQHWAFQRIGRPELPSGGHPNPVDAFLAAKHRELGLEAQPAAPRSIAIRRLYLDLVGLPPTRQQLGDPRPWAEIVDELLASPQHGERWGRHWMDVWRYSDWYGLGKQLRYSQKHLWHWRDWIVESLNADKGYDRMVLEMLAGDELSPADAAVLRATGFLARNYYLFNRTTWLDSTIEHTGKAFLGLTLNCAKCHDHKYDPVSQLDYYRFRALFEPHQVRLDPVPGETDLEKDGLPRAFDEHLDAPTYFHVRGDPKSPDEDREIRPGVPELFAAFAPRVEVVDLPHIASHPGAREHVFRDQLEVAQRAVSGAEAKFAQAKGKPLTPPAPKPQPAPANTAEAFELVENFDKHDAKRWKLEGDDWNWSNGVLRKTMSSRENNVVTLLPKPPRDFELVARYTTTGGDTYKSIGFRFDRSADGKSHHQVYTSAHAPEPKVQVSHSVGGKDQYPPSGKVRRPIKVGESYELRFAVRDRLLNVWLNGEFVLAYQLPKRHPDGAIAFTAFDATVDFDYLSVRSLSADLELKPASAKPAPAAATPVEVAEAELALRGAELASVEAVVAAERAKLAGSSKIEPLAREAFRRSVEVEIAKAELAIAKGDGKGAKALKAARKRLETGGTEYAAFRVSRKALETPAHKFEQYTEVYPARSTGRRSALARWVVHRDNPLTARVAVNHVWLRHFGSPLVETVDDFGRRAPRPEHAELLDWLAAEFIESGWSFKRLHRTIVTSEAYRRSSSSAGAKADTLAADPDNKHYWRMNSRRMESDILRDSLLHLRGELDLSLGGPPLDPKSGGRRRSLYFIHSRDHKDKFLSMFDHADHLACYRRAESIVPQQALALANSKLALESASKIAARVTAEDETAYVAAAIELLLGRAASDEELAACGEFLGEIRALGKDEATARARLLHALLNHNDFVTIR